MAEQGATRHSETFPVRLWIRRHYTKMRRTFSAKCKHCSKVIPIRPSFHLHNHLVEEHSSELTEEEKKDNRTDWTWDHFTIKDERKAICNICGAELTYKENTYIRRHLYDVHKILIPRSDDTDNVSSDANTDTTIKKNQIHSATSSKNTEQIDVFDENVADYSLNLPFRDLESHDLDLSIHEDIDEAECLSSPSQSSSTAFFDIEFCEKVFDHFTQK